MCSSVTCRVCGKTTWAGCGQHVAAVKRTAPSGQWCDGSHTAAEIAASKTPRGGFLTRLLGK